MKFGMNMLLWTTDCTEEHFPLFEKLKAIGYDGVELPIFDMQLERFQQVGKKLDSLKLERTAVTVCTDSENPISPDKVVRDAGLARLKKAVDMCAAAGCTHLCGPIHSAIGSFSGSTPTKDEWNYGKEVLSKAGDYAKQNNVMLVVEYLNRFECYFLTSAADDAKFCREINHSHVKMMWDTFHANIEEKNIAAAMQSCWDQVVHVHISENDRSTPGEGHVDWDSSFQMLKQLRYDGWLVVEAFGLSLPALAAATKIWRRMFPDEEYLAQHALAFMKRRIAG
jgi:D-psicose/D-tagatose/L-ribulose 3-epimerase